MMIKTVGGRAVDIRPESLTHEIHDDGFSIYVGIVCGFTVKGEKVDIFQKTMERTDVDREWLVIWAAEMIRKIST